MVTGSGAALFILGLSLTASAVKSLRVGVGGLLVHPYLFFLVPLLLLVGPPKILKFPKRVLYGLVAFEFIYILSVAMGRFSVDDILKMGAAGVTIITTAILVRTRADFRGAVIALTIATMVLSIYNISSGGEWFGVGSDSDNVKILGNKNAFSLYALPALLLALNLFLDKTVSKVIRCLLAICILVITVAILSSGNRSGWLGVLCIGVMMYGRNLRLRSAVLIGLLTLAAYYSVAHFTGVGEMQRRVNQTEEGFSGDLVRLDVASQSFRVGLENPFLGVSPSQLPRELAARLPREGILVHSLGDVKVLNAHNVILHLIGGSGFIALGALAYLGWQLWKRPPRNSTLSGTNPSKGGHSLLRMMIALWLLRGMFTDEVLYSPSFCIGLGLCIGLCIVDHIWISSAVRNDEPLFWRRQLSHLNTKS